MTNRSCRDAALSLLGRRLYSEVELRRKLSGYDADEVDDVIDELYELELLDDGAFAEMIRDHYAHRGYGIQRIRQELYARGVDAETIGEATAEFTPDPAVLERLIDRAGDRERAVRALQRRGFLWDEIRDAVARQMEEDWDE